MQLKVSFIFFFIRHFSIQSSFQLASDANKRYRPRTVLESHVSRFWRKGNGTARDLANGHYLNSCLVCAAQCGKAQLIGYLHRWPRDNIFGLLFLPVVIHLSLQKTFSQSPVKLRRVAVRASEVGARSLLQTGNLARTQPLFPSFVIPGA